MSDEKPSQQTAVLAKDLEMFKLYLEGQNYRQIGELYGVSTQVVYALAKKNDWKSRVAKYYRKAYDSILQPGIKKTAIRAYNIMEHYLNTVEAKIKENPNYYLTVEEIRELRQLFQVFQNENRLMDDKPTQNVNQKIVHELRLPPGVKHFGVDTPSADIKTIEHKEDANTDPGSNDDEIDSM